MNSIKIKVAAISLVFIFGLFLLEIISLITFSTYHYAIKGSSSKQLVSIISDRLRTIYGNNSENITYIGDYDPVTQMQFPANYKVDNFLKTNSYGYLGNSNAINLLNTFPKKKDLG